MKENNFISYLDGILGAGTSEIPFFLKAHE
jgi:hypothetical protein